MLLQFIEDALIDTNLGTTSEDEADDFCHDLIFKSFDFLEKRGLLPDPLWADWEQDQWVLPIRLWEDDDNSLEEM
jgi:hypothetical protein